jgi:hypothetical protein
VAIPVSPTDAKLGFAAAAATKVTKFKMQPDEALRKFNIESRADKKILKEVHCLDRLKKQYQFYFIFISPHTVYEKKYNEQRTP